MLYIVPGTYIIHTSVIDLPFLLEIFDFNSKTEK